MIRILWKVKGFTWESECIKLSAHCLASAARRHVAEPSCEIDSTLDRGEVYERGARVGTFEVIA